MSTAAGHPKNVTSGLARMRPTTPTLATTLTGALSVAAARAANAPTRKTANNNSAIPRISRLSEELPTGLPLAVWSELGDLSILVERDDGVGVYGSTCHQIIAEPRVAQRPTMLRGIEQFQDAIAVLPIDQHARLRRITQLDAGHPPRHVVHVPTRASGIFERELTLASCTHQGNVGTTAQRGAQHRQHRRVVDVRGNHHVTRALGAHDRCRSVRRGHDHGLAFDGFSREFRG